VRTTGGDRAGSATARFSRAGKVGDTIKARLGPVLFLFSPQVQFFFLIPTAFSISTGCQSHLHHGKQPFPTQWRFFSYPLESIPYAAMRRLMRELKELRTSPPEGIRVQLSEESMLDVVGIVEGPGEFLRKSVQLGTSTSRVSAEGTPYQGGYFRVKFEFTEEFPAAPPKCKVAVPRIWCLAGLMSSLRSVHHQDFPSKRLERGGDLC